jgi:hypothetical protein
VDSRENGRTVGLRDISQGGGNRRGTSCLCWMMAATKYFPLVCPGDCLKVGEVFILRKLEKPLGVSYCGEERRGNHHEHGRCVWE